jgi:hypothetical protein
MFDLIHSYTRKQAIQDKILIDVSEMAKEAGFKFPVAITNTVWTDLIVPGKEAEGYGQSIEGRLWDTLIMLHISIKQKEVNNYLLFEVLYSNGDEEPDLKELKAVIDGGDNGEPVITIMYKHED